MIQIKISLPCCHDRELDEAVHRMLDKGHFGELMFQMMEELRDEAVRDRLIVTPGQYQNAIDLFGSCAEIEHEVIKEGGCYQ